MQYPDVRNTDLSKMLGEEWKNAPSEVRQMHIDKEAREREEYYKKVAVWKDHHCKEEDFSSHDGKTVGKSGVFLASDANISLRVPQSYPSLASVSATTNLSPTAIPTTTNDLQKIVHSSMFQKPSTEGHASSISSWDGDATVEYTDVHASLIPTIPSSNILKFPSGSVLTAATRSLQNVEDTENLDSIFSRKSSESKA
jgi:hypothetical protein